MGVVSDGTTVIDNGAVNGVLSWQSVQTTGFTAVAGRAYPCNTTSAGFTVTLPATPSAGDQVQLVDYAGTFDSNALTINPNGEDLEGGASNLQLKGEREGVILTYIDSTQGWIATSGINEGTDALEPVSYSADFLVIAGGGGGGSFGGGGAGGYRNSFSTESSGGGGSSESNLTFLSGTVYTVTVGGGGAGSAAPSPFGSTGTNSSISGTGISTITSNGGGGGSGTNTAGSGGSGGGSADAGRGGVAGSGTANQGFAGNTGYSDEVIYTVGGGGGGAGAIGFASSTTVGGNGGTGLSSSITGSSVGRAGGGAGTGDVPHAVGGTGTSGGGNGGTTGGTGGAAGTVNTGGGGGGGSGAGGKGVVILRMPTASYSGTTTGSPTVGTDGTDTILTFNDSGSYTG